MCLESWHERTVNYTKIIPNRAWERDEGRNINTTECDLARRVYPFYLCGHYLSSASIRGVSAASQHGRPESWAPASHTKHGPVPSGSDAEPSSLTSLCQHLSMSGCLARAFLRSKPTDFKQLYASVQMPTGPLAVARLPLPVLLGDREGLWTPKVSPAILCGQAVQLCRSYSNLTGKKKGRISFREGTYRPSNATQ